MSGTVQADNGVALPLDDMSFQINYAVSGLVASITANYRGVDYIQEFDNDGTVITAIHPWRAV